MSDHRVLIVYMQGHGPNAYLMHKGKARWTKRRAMFHAECVRNGTYPARKVLRVVVEKVPS